MPRHRHGNARLRLRGQGGESPEGADVTRESACESVGESVGESAGESAEGGHGAAFRDRPAPHDDAAERASIAAAKRSTIAPAGSIAVTPSTLLPACQ